MCHITKVKNEMEPEKNLVNKNLEKAHDEPEQTGC